MKALPGGVKIAAVRGWLWSVSRLGVVVVLAVGLLASGVVGAKAFTLIETVTVLVAPTSGLPVNSFTAEAKVAYNCALNPLPRYYYFHWDSQANPVFWSAVRVPCVGSGFDTGPSPATIPPKGQNKIGPHKVVVLEQDNLGNQIGFGFHAYTIVWGKPFVTVSPTSGIPTAKFNIRGKFDWPGACPGIGPITFRFSWYKVPATRIPLWNTTVAACSGGNVDTGNSPDLIPPSPLNYQSTFVIHVAVYDSGGGAFGGAYGAAYTNTTLYKVLAAPPTPKSSPTTATCGAPGQPPCATPTSTPCQAAAVLKPGASDVAALIGIGALGVLPIGGVAMVFSPGLWRRRSRLSWLAALIGFSIVMLAAPGCTAIRNQVGNASPEQSQTVQSPSPTPTCLSG